MQISHLVEKERILNDSSSVGADDALDVVSIDASTGVRRGFKPSVGEMRHIGRSGWMQHLP